MADILLKQANLSEIPLRVLSTLPSTLPSTGYANLLCQDTVDGKRAFLRLPDGSLVNLFTENVEIDNTVTNNTTTTIYQIQDLPAPSGLSEGVVPTIKLVEGALVWGWDIVPIILSRKSVMAHRDVFPCTTTQTLATNSLDTYVNCTNSSAIVLTIPVGLGVGGYYELEVAQNGTGAVTVTPAASVTINGTNSSVVVPARYKVISMKCIGADTWVAYGV